MIQSATILVVDDHPATRAAIVEALQFDGYATLEAWNGLDALEIVTHHRPDAILVDLVMPVLDGWKFVERLRTIPGGADIPIILVSVQGSEETARDLGAAAFITKPFDVNALLNLVSRVRAAS